MVEDIENLISSKKGKVPFKEVEEMIDEAIFKDQILAAITKNLDKSG